MSQKNVCLASEPLRHMRDYTKSLVISFCWQAVRRKHQQGTLSIECLFQLPISFADILKLSPCSNLHKTHYGMHLRWRAWQRYKSSMLGLRVMDQFVRSSVGITSPLCSRLVHRTPLQAVARTHGRTFARDYVKPLQYISKRRPLVTPSSTTTFSHICTHAQFSEKHLFSLPSGQLMAGVLLHSQQCYIRDPCLIFRRPCLMQSLDPRFIWIT